MYQQAVECDKQFMRKENLRQVEMYMQREDFFDFCQNFQVLLYGAGNRGQDFIVYAKQCKIPITGFIVSDGQNRADEVLGLPVFYYSQIPYEKKNVIIVITSAIKEIENTLRDSEYNWVKFKDDFWREIQKYNC